jgi:acyl-CoA ligase (AMP-forming) (exosortase A-associated)
VYHLPALQTETSSQAVHDCQGTLFLEHMGPGEPLHGRASLLHELVDIAATRWPSRVALKFRQRDITYAELAACAADVAAGLYAIGVRRGDRVVVYLQNRPDAVKLALACSRLGAVFVPANPMLRARQVRHILQDSSARVLVGSHHVLMAMPELLEGSHRLIVCDGLGQRAISATAMTYDQLAKGGEPPPLSGVIDRDPAAILYTSGSSGRPKGVVISHRNIVSGAYIVAGYLGNVAEDRLLAALPLSFDYGFSQVTTAFTVGACAVLTNFSTATALIQEVAAEKITGLAGVPTMWAHLADSEWPAGVSGHLRYITNSGGAVPAAALRKLQSRLPNTQVFSMYGLTEAFRSTYLHPAELAKRPGSIGKAIPTQECLVVRPDGTACAPGETGELVHRGSLVALGYWNDAEMTKRRFRPLGDLNPGLGNEIAVWSGDLVRTDEDGFLYFVGRADQQIKTSGYRVSPSEIEEVVLEVPGVVEAVALGIPDDLLGSRIAVAVVAGAGESRDLREEIRQHCRMHMPAYMVPIHIRQVESLARNVNGKPDRAAIAAALGEFAATDSEAVHPLRVPR